SERGLRMPGPPFRHELRPHLHRARQLVLQEPLFDDRRFARGNRHAHTLDGFDFRLQLISPVWDTRVSLSLVLLVQRASHLRGPPCEWDLTGNLFLYAVKLTVASGTLPATQLRSPG